MNSTLENGYKLPTKELSKHQDHHIVVGEWHQLFNPFAEPCRIVEIQYGEECVEEDILRKE